jgi:eukaryotic-like serine/threonine-protein kinase
MSDSTLHKIGRYNILAELGRGAMGVVYKAEDPLLNRMVAIKTILLSAEAAIRDDYETRFLQEAKAAGGLNHPSIITIYDVGREGDLAYMAMELLDGTEMRNMLAVGRLSLDLALDIAAQVADGLAIAHERGVVHRDIKPANIMIVRGRQAKIMDFGIARLQVSHVKTQTGMVLGSPQYMSPEQIAGRDVDSRSDIFSLGVVLYQMIAGLPPFSGDDINQLTYMVCHGEHSPPSLLNPAIPPMLDLIVNKALAKNPAQRYQNARDMAADLTACRAQLVPAPAKDFGQETTTLPLSVDLALAATFPIENAGTSEASASLTGPAQDVAPGLKVSRKFDATQALQRLAAGEAATPRRRRNAELLVLAVALAAATIGAVGIVFF